MAASSAGVPEARSTLCRAAPALPESQKDVRRRCTRRSRPDVAHLPPRGSAQPTSGVTWPILFLIVSEIGGASGTLDMCVTGPAHPLRSRSSFPPTQPSMSCRRMPQPMAGSGTFPQPLAQPERLVHLTLLPNHSPKKTLIRAARLVSSGLWSAKGPCRNMSSTEAKESASGSGAHGSPKPQAYRVGTSRISKRVRAGAAADAKAGSTSNFGAGPKDPLAHPPRSARSR